MPKFTVIIPAAGSSTRFGGTKSKLVSDLAGLPVITRAVLPFVAHPDVDYILLPAPNDPYAMQSTAETTPKGLSIANLSHTGRANELWEALKQSPAIANRLGGQIDFVPGGPTRAHSVKSALRFVPDDCDFVAIHDAARPLVSRDLIDRTLAAAIEHGAAAPATPVNLTIKQSSQKLPAPVRQTLVRDQLWAMQTPQIVRRDALIRAFETCPLPLDQITDDLQLLELAGQETWLIPGEESNIKITTAQDLLLAALLLQRTKFKDQRSLP